MTQPRLTQKINSKDVELPIEEHWDSICKILRLAKLIILDEPQYLEIRREWLKERMKDIKGVKFHYKDNPQSSVYGEEFAYI